jgi:hypothetical protein
MGILEKMADLNVLDEFLGIIKKETTELPLDIKNGLTVYANGGYDEKFAMDIINKLFKNSYVNPISASREGGVATFLCRINGTFEDIEFEIRYPLEEY